MNAAARYALAAALDVAGLDAESDASPLARVRQHRRTTIVSYVWRSMPGGRWHRVHGGASRESLCGDTEPRNSGAVDVQTDIPSADVHGTCPVCVARWEELAARGVAVSS